VVVALAAMPLVVGILREIAPGYGFGFIDDGRGFHRRGGSGSIGGYLTGYLNGSGKVEATVAAVDAGVVPHRSWYLAGWVTRSSGVTMRSCRRVRRWWAAAVGLLPPAADTGCGWLWGVLLAPVASLRAPPLRRPRLLQATA
jgi:hypothetical protein